jgi:hypothetical protein
MIQPDERETKFIEGLEQEVLVAATELMAAKPRL